jgi:hypothetical protein
MHNAAVDAASARAAMHLARRGRLQLRDRPIPSELLRICILVSKTCERFDVIAALVSPHKSHCRGIPGATRFPRFNLPTNDFEFPRSQKPATTPYRGESQSEKCSEKIDYGTPRKLIRTKFRV